MPSPQTLPKTGPAPARTLLDAEFELIQDTIRAVGRAGRLPVHEQEDFRSYAWIQLLEGDCRRLSSFRGDCPLSAFLRIVLNRILLDYRNAAWGRWRPSQEARQGGPQAIELERLVLRDGYPLAALAEQTRTSSDQIERIRQRAAKAVSRRHREAPVAVVPEVASADPNPEEQLLLQALRARSKTLGESLTEALKALPAADRRLLSLRYEEGQSVSQIAAREGLSQKPLYRRFERILRALRCVVGGEGQATRECAAMLDWARMPLQ